MALRIPLVLSGIAVTELKPGDSLSSAPKFIPIVTRSGYIASVSLINGPFIPVVKRDSSVINITLSV